MASKIIITIIGDKKVLRNFSKFEKELYNPYEPLTSFSKIYMPSIQENFASQGRTFGKPWPKLNPRTIKRKTKYGWSPDPLVKTGAMKKNFRYQVRTKSLAMGSPGYKKTGLLSIYNPTKYFPFHQLGTKHIPRRVMLRIDESKRKLLLSLFIYWIKEKARRLFK